MPSQPVPDRGPTTTTERRRGGRGRPVASMPAAARQPHRGITKIHRISRTAAPKPLTAPVRDRRAKNGH